MFLRRVLLLVFVGFLLALLSAPGANAAAADSPKPIFAIQDLGLFPFVADDVAPGLNDAGEVSLWQDGSDAVRGAVWTQGKAALLSSTVGYPSSIASALTASGDAVGWTSTSVNTVDSRAVTQAVVWRKGSMTLLGTLGGQDSKAFGANSKGTVVGVSQCADGTSHAFVASAGHLQDLGTLPGGNFSQAYAINALGHCVGVSNSTLLYKHAVCWIDGKIQDLGLLPGGMTSSARAINTQDQIAGYADTPDGTHAFLYAKGKMHDLGTLGEDPSNAAALNDHGQVVGTAGFASDQHHAFLWQNGTMTDLNTLLVPDSPWILLQACAINNHGQIVCIGHRKGQQTHILLLTPTNLGRSGTNRTIMERTIHRGT